MRSAPGALRGKANEARAERAAVGRADSEHRDKVGAAALKVYAGTAAAPGPLLVRNLNCLVFTTSEGNILDRRYQFRHYQSSSSITHRRYVGISFS
jgi:hypothetical protein